MASFGEVLRGAANRDGGDGDGKKKPLFPAAPSIFGQQTVLNRLGSTIAARPGVDTSDYDAEYRRLMAAMLARRPDIAPPPPIRPAAPQPANPPGAMGAGQRPRMGGPAISGGGEGRNTFSGPGGTPRPIDLTGALGWGMTGASMVPGPIGMGAGLANTAMRANNVGWSDAARRSFGAPGLTGGQQIGGLFGLNSYGRGGRQSNLGDFRGVPVNQAGVGGYTLGEAQARERQRQLNERIGGNRGGGGGRSDGRPGTGGLY